MNLPVPLNARNVGECIYCGCRDKPLSKEHAVPYGLNGPWTLLNASCASCAKITQAFEKDTMRSLWPHVRNVLAMQTRRRDRRSSTLPLFLQRAGVSETIQVPRSDFPTYLPTPLFPPPAALWRATPIRGVFINFNHFIHVAGPTFEAAYQMYPGANFVGNHTNFSPEDFARTLAKIGFCAAVYALGLRPFKKTPIRGVILGTDPCIGHWVGSWHGERPVNDNTSGLHAIKVQPPDGSTEIHVFLRLFAQFGAPEYHVILGPADPEFVNSGDWPSTWD